jgi:hypothetical protein
MLWPFVISDFELVAIVISFVLKMAQLFILWEMGKFDWL